MSRVTRDEFVNSGLRLDLKDLDQGDKASLARAGLDAAKLARIAGQDGVIEGKAELGQLFAEIDKLDRDGSYGSIATTTRNPQGGEVATASGKALAALQAEVAEARLAHQVSGGKTPAAASPAKTPAAAPPAKTPADSGKPAPADRARPNDPEYLKNAFGELGVKETRGDAATKRILEYFDATYQPKGSKNAHTDDGGRANAWCAAFLTWAFKEEDPKIKTGKAVGAREYEKFGEASEPFRGAIVVLQHGKQKHVAILVGVDKQGNNVYLGGNQGNKVSVTTLPGYEILAVRKPPGHVVTPESKVLPQIDAGATKQTR